MDSLEVHIRRLLIEHDIQEINNLLEKDLPDIRGAFDLRNRSILSMVENLPKRTRDLITGAIPAKLPDFKVQIPIWFKEGLEPLYLHENIKELYASKSDEMEIIGFGRHKSNMDIDLLSNFMDTTITLLKRQYSKIGEDNPFVKIEGVYKEMFGMARGIKSFSLYKKMLFCGVRDIRASKFSVGITHDGPELLMDSFIANVWYPEIALEVTIPRIINYQARRIFG